jgi:hypothetical protein
MRLSKKSRPLQRNKINPKTGQGRFTGAPVFSLALDYWQEFGIIAKLRNKATYRGE